MDKLLKSIEFDITRIKTRLRYLQKILDELNRLAGHIGFQIENDIIYQMIQDSNDMVVIDLASMCRGMLARGGFFNQLNNHRRKLKRTNMKNIPPPKMVVFDSGMTTEPDLKFIQNAMSEEIKKQQKKALDDAFDRLFPPRLQKKWWCFSKGEVKPITKATQKDIEDLKNRFERIVHGVIRDRDAKRAHRYERRKSDSKVERLSLRKLEEEFKKIEQIINDIRSLTIGGHFIYEPPTRASLQTTSEDIADMVILGSYQKAFYCFGVETALKAGNSSSVYLKQFREDFYLKKWRKRLLKTIKIRAGML